MFFTHPSVPQDHSLCETHSARSEIRWLLDRSPVMLPIPGTSSVAHLEENMRAVAD
jgi:pyridoxine 4-dehydrogenase